MTIKSIGSTDDTVLGKGSAAFKREPTVTPVIERSNPIQKEIDRLEKTLPANQQAQGNINYLGSSYSGADIKVVAHTYDKWKIEEQDEKLENEKAIADAVVSACQQLINGGFAGLADNGANNILSYDERRLAFLQAAGLQQDNSLPEKVLMRNIFDDGNFTFLGVARMLRVAQILIEVNQKRSEDITEEIKFKKNQDTTSTIVLGSLQTLSVQSHREKFPVRALGHSYAKAYTRGTRTIAGSMIFTIFNENSLAHLTRGLANSNNYGEKDDDLGTLLPDQLPPIDLTILFANEYGSLSDLRLYGVEFVNDGSTFSIEDLLSEQIVNFVCRDADVMTSRGKVTLSRLQRGGNLELTGSDQSATTLLFNNDDYDRYLDRLGLRRRLKNR